MHRIGVLLSIALSVASLAGCRQTLTEPSRTVDRGGTSVFGGRLSRTQYLAFGDSLTAGITSSLGPSRDSSAGDWPSYPRRLLEVMSAHYRPQRIEVRNEGRPGEFAEDGVRRLAQLLQRTAPEVVIVLHGVNDVSAQGAGAARRTAAFIQTMIRDARLAGAEVIVATLPPQRPGAPRAADAGVIASYNRALREVALGQNAPIADLEAGMTDLRLIGSDGLHPTAAGYARIAEILFTVIRREFSRRDWR